MRNRKTQFKRMLQKSFCCARKLMSVNALPSIFFSIGDTLRNLVPFVQLKERGKHPWRGATFSKTKSNTPPWLFFTMFKFYK